MRAKSVEIKDELKNTSINITCYDRNGKVAKNATSDDKGNVEEPDDNTTKPGGEGDTTTPDGGGGDEKKKSGD